jgi:hypothetical protein
MVLIVFCSMISPVKGSFTKATVTSLNSVGCVIDFLKSLTILATCDGWGSSLRLTLVGGNYAFARLLCSFFSHRDHRVLGFFDCGFWILDCGIKKIISPQRHREHRVPPRRDSLGGTCLRHAKSVISTRQGRRPGKTICRFAEMVLLTRLFNCEFSAGLLELEFWGYFFR